MNLAELKNEQAIEALADMIEPAAEILADESVAEVFRKGGQPIIAIKNALKGHPTACVKLLAASEGIPYEEYECSLLTIPAKLMALINTPEIRDFLSMQAEIQDLHGSALESTEDQSASDTSQTTSKPKTKRSKKN